MLINVITGTEYIFNGLKAGKYIRVKGLIDRLKKDGLILGLIHSRGNS